MRFVRIRILALTVLTAATVGATLTACSSSSKDTKPVASISSLTGKSTSVKLDSGFVAALTTLKLTPGVLGTAALADGSVSFPITGGNVTVYKKGQVNPYVQGDIQHQGSGLSLSSGSTVVKLENFDINPGNSKLYGDVTVNGATAATHAYLFNLDGSTLQPLQTGDGTATLTGTRVLISPDAAKVLNDTFKTDAVKEGLLVGIATIVVNT
jgi:hypothetical protein